MTTTRIKSLDFGVDLLICTPGRLHDLVNKPDKYTGQVGGNIHDFLAGKQTHGKMRILFQSINHYLVFLFFWGALWWAAENRVVLSESIQIWTEHTFKHIVFTQLCTQKCQKSIRSGFYSEVLGYNHLVPCNSHAKSCLQFVFKSHLVMDTSG